MADKLLINVERNYEAEEGFEASELFTDPTAVNVQTFEVATNETRPSMTYNKTAKRWIATPLPESNSDVTATWDVDPRVESSIEVGTSALFDGGSKVVHVLEEATDGLDWYVGRRTALEPGRGILLWFLVYQCEDETYKDKPLTIWLDNRWSLKFTGGASTPGVCTVSLRDGEVEQVYSVFPLLSSPLRENEHQIWIQPLDHDEFMVCNYGDQDKCITLLDPAPPQFDPDELRDDDQDYVNGTTSLPFYRVMRFEGYSRAVLGFRYCKYPVDPAIYASGLKSLGYMSTQDVTVTGRYWQPCDDSRYTCELTVYEDEAQTIEWAADPGGQHQYSWRLACDTPDELSGYSKMGIVVDRATMSWPKVYLPDGRVALDMFAVPGIQVISMEEYRDENDWNSSMRVVLRGKADDINTYIIPNDRWQWQLDLGGGTFDVRFDGLLNSCQQVTYNNSDHEAILEFECEIHSRWRQARHALYRGGIPFDGLKRSEAYTKLLAQIPIDTTNELSIGTLVDDDPLPTGRNGEQPAFEAEIGTPILNIIQELRDGFGPYDYFFWNGNGTATSKLYITQPSQTSSVAAFYRSYGEAYLNGAETMLIASKNKTSAMTRTVDDIDFYNDIWVVGLGKRSAENGETTTFPIWCHYQQPDSWKNPLFAQYINMRKPLIVYDPSLQTGQDVMEKCYNLALKYAVFNRRYVFSSRFVNVAPGQAIAIDKGVDPWGEGDVVATVRSMRTVAGKLGADAGIFRYQTTYEVSKR